MPRSKIVDSGRGSLTLVVKKVKNRLYVYDEYRTNGKVNTFYVGPLEEMVRIFQLYKSLGKVEKLSKRDIRRLAKMLLDEYLKKLAKRSVVNSTRKQRSDGNGWSRRRGLNPGPPPYQGGALPAELRRLTSCRFGFIQPGKY